MFLSRDPELKVVGEVVDGVVDGVEAVERSKQLRPGMVLTASP